MRIDVVTIFPEYFQVLDVSLVGKARTEGLADIRVHDLREWTEDVHRTVDDAPFGGGPGMVMKPDVWGKALDDVLGEAPPAPDEGPWLIVPTPAGIPFTQTLARSMAGAPRLVFACGRYEGIDARVACHYRREGFRVSELSIGDYVLNGGEVAALAIVEAVLRLIPGFVGNPESIADESHTEQGLLEAPAYTRPASWRGLDVPSVLLSGNHGEIARWRGEESERLTRERRPDLLG
jgi:tRNA (guanine37-N1)-methyltransferase